MAGKVAALQRDVDRLQGLTQDAELRPVFAVFTTDGTFLAWEDLDGDTVSKTESDDVVFNVVRPLLDALRSSSRYVVIEGGRASGKSYGIGIYLIARSLVRREKILCARETQRSLSESVKSVLEEIIRADSRLHEFFDIQRDVIRGRNGSEFHFRGLLDHQVDNIRSFQGASICWTEESQMVGRRSLTTLIPTIRGADNAQVFMSMNRRFEQDPVYVDFIAQNHPQATTLRINYDENPWCPAVIRQDAKVMRERNPEMFAHVYGGNLMVLSELRIFDNWTVVDFDIQDILERRAESVNVGYHGTVRDRRERKRKALEALRRDHFVGLDVGYTDPNALTISYADPSVRELYILDEYYQNELTNRQLAEAIRRKLELWNLEGWPVTMDSARPEIRDELNRYYGVNAVSCKKTKIIDGIDALKSWRVMVHPRCEHVAEELALYSWRTDRNGEILPIPEDSHNHTIDSLRYGVGDALSAGNVGYKQLSGVWV